MSISPERLSHLRPVGAEAQITPERADERVARAKNGDTAAWARLYQEHFDGLYRHLGYLTHDPVAAEDLVQETFARAFANLHRFDGRSTFTTWLHGIGVNVVRKYWRTNSRREKAYEKLERSRVASGGVRGGDPELSHVREQRARALLAIVETLPPKLREAYVLLDLRELPRREVSAQLGITEGNLSVRATRARARVHEELCRLGWIGA